jgi:hypothetical protein
MCDQPQKWGKGKRSESAAGAPDVKGLDHQLITTTVEAIISNHSHCFRGAAGKEIWLTWKNEVEGNPKGSVQVS